jgi:hypothetical protein
MLTKVLAGVVAAVAVAAVGVWAGVGYSDGTCPLSGCSQAACPVSAAADEPSCCAATHACTDAAEETCCAGETCCEAAKRSEAVAACAGGATFIGTSAKPAAKKTCCEEK